MPVELIFIHGWGFDNHFWDALAPRLSRYGQTRFDCGYFTGAEGTLNRARTNRSILVGHSLGFVRGIKKTQDWKGWVAINSFACFNKSSENPGCATEAELRDIGKRLQADPKKALQDFYKYIGAIKAPVGRPRLNLLRQGLDELHHEDISGVLEKLDIPGLVLASREDPLIPLSASEHLGALARKGGIVWQDQPSHVLPQTAPAWCALAIENFIKENFGDE